MSVCLATERNLLTILYVGQSHRNFFTRDNSPSWWPKDVAFSHLGIFYSQIVSKCVASL